MTTENRLSTIAIIMPARNEARHIGSCLDALGDLDYPPSRLERLVVDNGSTDDTASLAKARSARVISSTSPRVGGVRNAGARETDAEILGFLDADCIVNPRWASEAADTFAADDTVGAVGGVYLENPRGNWVERAWPAPPPERAVEVDDLPGGSLIVRRRVFEEVGGFDESLSAGEDDDLCRRIREAGYRILCLPDCHVIHLGYPRTLVGIARRQIWHGSNQLDVAESLLDRQLVLTHTFLVGGLVLIGSAILASAIGAGVGLALVVFPPVALAVRKAAGRDQLVRRLTQLMVIGLFFYAGRTLGLLKNYTRRLTGGVARRREYPSKST